MGKEQISIKLVRNGISTERVKEKENVIIQIENNGDPLDNASLWLGKALVSELDNIPSNSVIETVLNAGEYIGDAVVSLRSGDKGSVCAQHTIIVEPEGMDIEGFYSMVKDRIPYLMDSVGVENVLDLIPRGAEIKQESKTVDYHIDILLNRYSRNLLQLSAEIMSLMTYDSLKIEGTYRDQIKGTVKWNKTMQMRARKGLNYSTTHVCEIRKKTLLTPTNLVFFKFHKDILGDATNLLSRYQHRESEKLMWRRIYKLEGEDYDPAVVRSLSLLRKTIKTHGDILSDRRYSDVVEQLKRMDGSEYALLMEATQEAEQAKNRSYMPLITLYKDFVKNYVPDYIRTIVVDAKRMEEVYQLWALYEIANAFQLRSVSHSMREYKNVKDSTYMHFQNLESILSPWTEPRKGNNQSIVDGEDLEDRSMIGPNIYLVRDKVDIYVHTLYEEHGKGLSRKNRYQVLGYMDDFDLRYGIVLYPGSKVQFNYDEGKRKNSRVLLEIPMIPQVSGDGMCTEGIEDYLKYAVDSVLEVKKQLDSKKDPSEQVMKSVTGITAMAEKIVN